MVTSTRVRTVRLSILPALTRLRAAMRSPQCRVLDKISYDDFAHVRNSKCGEASRSKTLVISTPARPTIHNWRIFFANLQWHFRATKLSDARFECAQKPLKSPMAADFADFYQIDF